MSWIDRLIQTEDAMVAQAVARERERCAQICDAEAKRLKTQQDSDVWCGYADTGAMVCANLIRTGNSYGVAPTGGTSNG